MGSGSKTGAYTGPGPGSASGASYGPPAGGVTAS
jgi:hypothetical protein